MANHAGSPHFAARLGPSYLGLFEANRSLQIFSEQGPSTLERFNDSPPAYRSRSMTPVETDGVGEQEDDPAILRALEETARTFPIKWAANPYAGMTQEERLLSIERGKELDRAIAREKREKMERHDRFFSQPTTANLFTGKERIGPPLEAALVNPPKPSISTSRKRKRNDEPETAPEPVEAVRKPTGRPRKRTRTARISEQAPAEISGGLVAEEQPTRLRTRNKKGEPITLPDPQSKKAVKRGRKGKGDLSINDGTPRQPPIARGVKAQAARKRPGSKAQTPVRRSKRIAKMASRRSAG